MPIDFRLPAGAGGMAALHASRFVHKEVDAWAHEHAIQAFYHKSSKPYTIRITFSDDRLYTLFSLTWVPKSSFTTWDRITMTPDHQNN